MSHHLDDDFPFGPALFEVGEGVGDAVEREHAVGDHLDRPLVDQSGKVVRSSPDGCMNR